MRDFLYPGEDPAAPLCEGCHHHHDPEKACPICGTDWRSVCHGDPPEAPSVDILRRAKERAVGLSWLPFEAIDIEAGVRWGTAKERVFLSAAISETPSAFWPREDLAVLFDRAIALAEAEEREAVE